MAEPKLYLIATPLGNLGDITLRALEVLRELRVVFAEDSREFLKLLELYDIASSQKKVMSYALHNMKEATEKALVILREGESIGLVTDRGTPGISDPGALLVGKARAEGFKIVPIPGACSVATALSAYGENADRFVFLGFLPAKAGERRESLIAAGRLQLPVCFFESPKRIEDTLNELKGWFPHGRVFLAREMTKVFETFSWVNLTDEGKLTAPDKGEYVVVLEPGVMPPAEGEWEAELRRRIGTDRDWSKEMAEKFGRSASECYNDLQRQKPPRKT